MNSSPCFLFSYVVLEVLGKNSTKIKPIERLHTIKSLISSGLIPEQFRAHGLSLVVGWLYALILCSVCLCKWQMVIRGRVFLWGNWSLWWLKLKTILIEEFSLLFKYVTFYFTMLGMELSFGAASREWARWPHWAAWPHPVLPPSAIVSCSFIPSFCIIRWASSLLISGMHWWVKAHVAPDLWEPTFSWEERKEADIPKSPFVIISCAKVSEGKLNRAGKE